MEEIAFLWHLEEKQSLQLLGEQRKKAKLIRNARIEKIKKHIGCG